METFLRRGMTANDQRDEIGRPQVSTLHETSAATGCSWSVLGILIPRAWCRSIAKARFSRTQANSGTAWLRPIVAAWHSSC